MRKEKSASKREQRQVYLNVAEREQIQVRKAGLNEKCHAGLISFISQTILFTRLLVYLSTKKTYESALSASISALGSAARKTALPATTASQPASARSLPV